jgi:hypothetical protein
MRLEVRLTAMHGGARRLRRKLLILLLFFLRAFGSFVRQQIGPGGPSEEKGS